MESQDNDLFQSIIESFPRSVLVLDITGHITYANPATTELTGYSREEILGKHFTKLGFLRLQDVPKLITFSSELLRGESLKQIEIAYKTKEGATRWGVGYITVLKIDGKISGIQVISEEITEQKRLAQSLRHSEEKYRIFGDATKEGWIEIETDGTIISVNQIGAKILGYEPDELIGTLITNYYVYPEKRAELVNQLLRDGFVVDYRIEFKGKNNKRGYISINGTVYEDETTRKPHFVTTFRDVTPQINYFQRLEALLKHAAALSRASTVDEVAEITEETLTQTIGFDRGSMGIVEENILNHRYRWGVETEGEFKLPLDGTGITVKAIKTGETQQVDNVEENPLFVDAAGDMITKSELTVPVIIAQEAVAVLNIESEKIKAFSELDRKLMEIFAEQVSSTLQRIQAQRAQREILERFSAFRNAASESFVVLDREFNIIDVNRIGAQRFGVNREEVIGRSLFNLQPDLKNSERYRQYIEIMETGIPNVFDVYDHYSGIEFLRINAFKVGEGLGLIASDLTELRNEQEARARLDQELFEQKILADQLVEMDRMKTNLMNTAAHEIRTPITAIKGYAELMEGIITEEKNPALNQYLEVITRNINRLERLSNDLLDMQRIKSNRMIIEKEKIEIASLMDAISQEMRLLLKERNQTLEINISTDEKIIFCNEMRMTQVLINLVSNASHYSPTDTKIEVNVTFAGDKHQITVKDNGVGISEENMPKLFIPFPDIQSNIQRGTGLGLSICKEIIQLHGGQIWAESEGIGKGSTFSFTIPK